MKFITDGNEPDFATQYEDEGQIGLSKREYFAAIALQGILANSEYTKDGWNWKAIAGDAIDIADALINELNK